MKDANKSTAAIGWFCLVAWLIPGAGHWLIGKRSRGVTYFVFIVGLFIAGMFAFHSELLPDSIDAVSVLCFIGRLGSGFLFICAWLIGGGSSGPYTIVEAGNVYTTIAGILNFLVVLNLADLLHFAGQKGTGGR